MSNIGQKYLLLFSLGLLFLCSTVMGFGGSAPIRWLPAAILVLQDEQPQSETESEADVPEEPAPSAPPQIQPQIQPQPEPTPDNQSANSQSADEAQPQIVQRQRPQGEPGQGRGQGRGERGEQGRGGGNQPPGGMQGPPGGRGGPPAPPPVPSVVREPRLEPAEQIRFSFRYAPWKDVIEWFADQAALNLQADKMPTGSLNLTDSQAHTPMEALDILNDYLLFKNYTLLRKGKTLFVLYLPDGIPPNLLEPITADELDSRGKYEICKCVFNLNRTTPDIVQAEIERLLGPQGNILPMPRSQQIVVTETGGTLRTIREIIRRIDDPDALAQGVIHTVEMRNLTAEEALQMMRTLLAIDATDTSLRTTADSSGKKIFLSGRGDMIERAKDVLNRIDSSFGSNDPAMRGQPQFDVYDTGSADPATILAVLQTLLVGTPDVRLSLDPRTGGIAVQGRPAVHATVREAIKQMQLNVPQIGIIPLKRMSPQSAVETIKKFYQTYSPLTASTTTTGRGDGGGGGQRGASAPATTQLPTVEPDVMARRIIVRGTLTQITEIRALLASLGEDGTGGPVLAASTVRAVPLSPTATSLVLEQLQGILPKLDPNIKVVLPAVETEKKAAETNDADQMMNELIDKTFDKEVPVTRLLRIMEQPILAQVTPQAEVTVSVTPAGFVLSSNDPEALNKVEEVIRMLSDETVLGRIEFREYYLKHSTASVVSSALQSMMGTSAPGLTASGITSVDLPEWQQSELLGLISAQSNAVEKTGTVTVSVDERLNALWIQANPVDHKTIEKLLEILDQPGRDDIMSRARIRLIEIKHMRAEEAKTYVDQAFANRTQGTQQANRGGQQGALGGGNQQQRGGGQQGAQPNAFMAGEAMPGGGMGGPIPPPIQQMMAAMASAGGRGGSTPREQEPPLTVTVLPQTNLLAVSSSEATFLEVEAFVKQIDAMAANQQTVTENVRLVNITPAFAQQSLTNLFGSAVQISTNSANNRTSGQQMGGMFGGAGNLGGGIGNFGGGTTGGTRQGGTFGGGNFGAGNVGTGTIGGARQGGAFGGGNFGAGNVGIGTFGGVQQGGTFGGARAGGAFGGGNFSTGAIGGGGARTGGTFGGGAPAR